MSAHGVASLMLLSGGLHLELGHGLVATFGPQSHLVVVPVLRRGPRANTPCVPWFLCERQLCFVCARCVVESTADVTHSSCVHPD